MSGSGWSVSVACKRRASWSVKLSCAPGCARSRRTITRDAVGQAVRSSCSVISATCPFSRSLPSAASAQTHAFSGVLRISARTWSVSS